MVEELILSGADIIKVGIGPGKSNPDKQGQLPIMLVEELSRWNQCIMLFACPLGCLDPLRLIK